MKNSELSDKEQIEMLSGIFEHSDFTKTNFRIFDLKKKLDQRERELGCLTVDDALKIIVTVSELDQVALLYDPAPYWLIDSLRGVVSGRVKLRKNKKPLADWTNGRDIAGIYEELTRRFGFDKKLVYQFIAEACGVPGIDRPCETYGIDSEGADSVKSWINRNKKDV